MVLQRKKGFYERYIKRFLDIICSLLAIIVFCWLYVLLAVLVKIKLGSPVIFKQPRPGMIDRKTGKERIFNLYKFRSMTEEKDENGNFLPDEVRLTKFGKMLRATSLDELPEVFNILMGDMSIIGPRPQLVKDMVFMSTEQRIRHTARPGLSGLAQVKGRNSISWEDKLKWDMKYLERVSFGQDAKIILMTIKQVFIRKNITESSDEIDVTLDFGDELLKNGKVSVSLYNLKNLEAKQILESQK